MKWSASIILVIAANTPAMAQDGGFGIRMGAPVSSLSVVEKDKNSKYIFWVKPPKPNTEFDLYMVIATPKAGVCKVLGAGKSYKSDSYGVSGRSAFDRFHGILSAKYGKSEDFNYLRAGAIWKEPRDFAMSLKENERQLSSFWTVGPETTLPVHIQGISLKLKAVSLDATYLTIAFEYTNFDACMVELDSEDQTGL